MIAGLLDSGAMPALERMVQFTSQRHNALAEGIANLSTPFHKPSDLSVEGFQAAMRDAIDQRRRGANPIRGRLEVKDTRELAFESDRIVTTRNRANQNVLFHDQNNRDLERMMQGLAENTLAHNAGIEMLKNQFEMLRTAIRERM